MFVTEMSLVVVFYDVCIVLKFQTLQLFTGRIYQYMYHENVYMWEKKVVKSLNLIVSIIFFSSDCINVVKPWLFLYFQIFSSVLKPHIMICHFCKYLKLNFIFLHQIKINVLLYCLRLYNDLYVSFGYFIIWLSSPFIHSCT